MYESAYGEIVNNAHVVHLSRLEYDEQLDYIKKLWQVDPIRYSEWKKWCVQCNCLPKLYGTRDDPIFIDEASL